VEGYDKVLRKDADPYNLEGFYPQAEPLYAVSPTHQMGPVPEFNLYKKQADELDELQDRIAKLNGGQEIGGLEHLVADDPS
jgi:hypothetical protein